MRYFTFIDFQHVVLGFFLGLAAAVVIYISFRYKTKRRNTEEVDPTDSHTLETMSNNPIPPVLVFTFAGTVVAIILYALFYVLTGEKAF